MEHPSRGSLEVARTLRLIWEEFFRELLPNGVDAQGLHVLAACCGRLTVAAMVPAGMLPGGQVG